MTGPAESLLACVGLRRVLEGSPPTPADVKRSVGLEDEVKAAVAAYLDGQRTPPPDVELELPDYLPLDGDRAIAGLEPEVATAYALAAARALAYLKDLVPPRRLPGLAAKLAQPSAMERARLRRATAAVNDPIAVLGDLGALSHDHLDAIQAVYPTLWSLIGPAAAEASDRDLTSRQQRTIARLMGVSAHDVPALQELHRHEEKQPQTAQGPAPGEGPGLATPMQQLASQ